MRANETKPRLGRIMLSGSNSAQTPCVRKVDTPEMNPIWDIRDLARMTIHNRKTGRAAAARKPVDIQLARYDAEEAAEMSDRRGEPPTATLRFDFGNADPEILRALQEACESNGIDMRTAPACLPPTDTYSNVKLPSDFKGKPN